METEVTTPSIKLPMLQVLPQQSGSPLTSVCYTATLNAESPMSESPMLNFEHILGLQLNDGLAQFDVNAEFGWVNEAFWVNLDRVRALGELTPLIVGLTIEFRGRIDQMRKCQEAGDEAGHREAITGIQAIRETSKGRPIQHLTIGRHFAGVWGERLEVRKGFYALFSSQIIGAWTAVEVLAADLWEAFLNKHPEFGVRALNAKRAAPDKRDGEGADDDEEVGAEIDFTLPIDKLKEWQFNLKSRMGTLLRTKWNFSKRREAAEAYHKVFPENQKQINAILHSRELRWLAATRHLIVHKAGKADADFLGKMKKHPIFGSVPEGQQIPLDGSITAALFNGAFRRGDELLQFACQQSRAASESKGK
jgi:hypothetical protein